MQQITVGIGDMAVSRQPVCTLVTYGLGSCIALTAWDPDTRVAGLLHFMFPDSNFDAGRLRDNPSLFGDTGIPLLLRSLVVRGANASRLVLRAAGGATVMQGPNLFRVGERNRESMDRILAAAGMTVASAALGGSVSRTMRIEANSGRCWVEQERRIIDLRVQSGTPGRIR